MLALALLFLAAPSPPKQMPDGYWEQWVAAPQPAELLGCFKRVAILDPQDVDILMSCRSAAGDRLTDCKVISNTRSKDPRYEQAALCASQHFRIRVTDSAGTPVVGAEVKAPFRIQVGSPAAQTPAPERSGK